MTQFVLGGVGEHRDAAGGPDPVDHPVQVGPTAADIAGLTAAEKFFKGLVLVLDKSGCHHMAGKVGAAQGSTVRMPSSPRQGVGNAVLRKFGGYFLRPAVAGSGLVGNPFCHGITVGVDIQTQYMDADATPAGGKLHPRDQPQVDGGSAELVVGVQGIVIRNSQSFDTRLPGGLHQRGRAQGAVGSRGVGMEVAFHGSQCSALRAIIGAMDQVQPISHSQQLRVIDEVEWYIREGERHYGRDFDTVPVLFDLMGVTAGMYRVRARERVIRFNPWIFAKYFDDSLATTVPHEVAHYLTDQIHGLRDIRPHGSEWRELMAVFGADDSVTSNYCMAGIPRRRQRRFDYGCACRRHQLSASRHNRILRRQAVYHCRYCGERLRALS